MTLKYCKRCIILLFICYYYINLLQLCFPDKIQDYKCIIYRHLSTVLGTYYIVCFKADLLMVTTGSAAYQMFSINTSLLYIS